MTLSLSASLRQRSSPAQRLRREFAAVRVSFTWLGVRKTLSPDQKAQAAESFGAQGQYLSAAKKLLDTRHSAFQAVSSVRSRIISFWKGMSLPYPEPGLRLIRQDQVEFFDQHLKQLAHDLHEAVERLEEQFGSLRSAAQERLGSLYDPGDYPQSLRGLFQVEWDYPSVEPASYLMQLSPELYQQEKERVAARFDEAVKLAEEAFTGEFAKLVSHLCERLCGGADGQKKVLRDSAITNLKAFFERFRSLGISSSQELDELVEQVQQLLEGVDPQGVRSSETLRQQIGSELSGVQRQLEELLVDQPRRRILRKASQEG